MGRTPKNVSDNDAIEITKFLLNKDIPQTQIAEIVDRSRSWVSRLKKEIDIRASAKEEGRQEMQNTIINNVVSELARRMVESNNASLCSNNTALFHFGKVPNTAINR